MRAPAVIALVLAGLLGAVTPDPSPSLSPSQLLEKMTAVPLAVVLFHWSGLDTRREEAILADVERSLAFCLGTDAAFVGKVDAWDYGVAQAAETLRNGLQIALTGASFQVLKRESRDPDGGGGEPTLHWASVVSLQLDSDARFSSAAAAADATAASTLTRVAKEESARLRGLSDAAAAAGEVCHGALARIAILDSPSELHELVRSNDVAIVATSPSSGPAADRLELIGACDIVPGARCAFSSEAAVAEAAGAPADEPDVRIFVRGKLRHSFHGLGRDDLRTWVAELGLSLLVRATAESLDELIRGPLPVVLVSLTRNTVMEAGVGGDESIYGDEGWGYRDAGGVSGRGGGGGGEVRNGTAGNRGGRTLEDIVRTVAADYTDSVRFAFYFDEDLPLLGEALGVELPAPGQPLFSWEAKGGLRFLFPHPVNRPLRRASDLFRRFVKNSLHAALTPAPKARVPWERHLGDGGAQSADLVIESGAQQASSCYCPRELDGLIADMSADTDLFLLVQWRDSSVHKMQRSFAKAVEALPSDPNVLIATYEHSGRLSDVAHASVRHVLSEGTAAVVHRSRGGAAAEALFDDWRMREGVSVAAARLGAWMRDRLDLSAKAAASLEPLSTDEAAADFAGEGLTDSEEREWAEVVGRIDSAITGAGERCPLGAAIPVPPDAAAAAQGGGEGGLPRGREGGDAAAAAERTKD